MILSIIAAVSSNGVIGHQGGIPWRLPDDFKHFRATTMGCPLIMGRKTWESIGKPLPGRTIVVLSSQYGMWPVDNVVHDGVFGTHNFWTAQAFAKSLASDAAFVAGGSELYAYALPYADRLYLTRVHAEVEGDTFFPAWKPEHWVERSRVDHAADERHEHAFTCYTYERAR